MLRIEALTKAHKRRLFDCGSEALNRFLQQFARQHAEREISRTFILVDDEAPLAILGYLTLTACEVVATKLPESHQHKYPHPMSAAKLARLAVAKDWQRKEYGKLMLIETMRRTLAVGEHVGLIGLFVDAKDVNASVYYQSLGFVEVGNDTNSLFMPLKTIREALE
ncbi:MAG: GNAT family N-acetyltransferase [Ectothiorhodospiraceae bacterium]|nr:GNAT family N-acetyltransferase [Ectothiorhodospiraceae bacterium]